MEDPFEGLGSTVCRNLLDEMEQGLPAVGCDLSLGRRTTWSNLPAYCRRWV
jgi:hypothetical protein